MAFYLNKISGIQCFVNNDEIFVYGSNEKDANARSIKLTSVPLLKNVDLSSLEEKSSKDPENKQNTITSIALSNDGNLISSCDSKYCLLLWKNEDSNWVLNSTRFTTRKTQKIIFTNSSREIILADRAGDVFSFSVSDSKECGKYLLGHTCFILDVAISFNDKYLATCDRDGKIRVSCYPNCYNILNYCLGHTEFISSIQFLQLEDEVLLSSSGDGTVRVWHSYKNECMQQCLSLYDDASHIQQTKEISNTEGEKHVEFSVRGVKYCDKYHLFVVIFYVQKGIAVYKLSNDTKYKFTFKQYISLDVTALDALFDSGDLLILLRKDFDALKYFKYHENSQLYTLADLPSTFNGVRDFYKIYQSNLNFSDDFVSMFKRAYEAVENDSASITKRNKSDICI